MGSLIKWGKARPLNLFKNVQMNEYYVTLLNIKYSHTEAKTRASFFSPLCLHAHTCICGGQSTTCQSALSPCPWRFWGPNAGHQAHSQVPFPAEQSCQPVFNCFTKYSFIIFLVFQDTPWLVYIELVLINGSYFCQYPIYSSPLLL